MAVLLIEQCHTAFIHISDITVPQKPSYSS